MLPLFPAISILGAEDEVRSSQMKSDEVRCDMMTHGAIHGAMDVFHLFLQVLDPLLEPLLQKAKFKAGNMIMSLGTWKRSLGRVAILSFL